MLVGAFSATLAHHFSIRMAAHRFCTGWQWCLLFFALLIATSCHTDQRDQTRQTTNQPETYSPKHHRHKHKHNQNLMPTATSPSGQADVQTGAAPANVQQVLAFVRQNNHAPDGYVGGRTFGNFENHLPKQDASGSPIRYQEWDVHPKIRGQNRGVERLITGSDGRAYYTADHYNTFTEFK